MRFIPISLSLCCLQGLSGANHLGRDPAIFTSSVPSLWGGFAVFGAPNAALTPLQSFDEPRCDLRENLLRYGCREASIVYMRGEMRTEQVGAGRHCCLGSSRGAPPSSASFLYNLLQEKCKIQTIFFM